MQRSLSVIYAAYNEESNIRDTITRSLEALRSRFQTFELLIINDKSRDRTGEIAEELARAHPEISVIHNEKNIGQGASLAEGFRRARCDLVIHNAMDYPFDLCDLDRMVPLLDEADVVAAARSDRPSYTAYRRFLSWGNLALLHLLFDLKLDDYNFVQLFRREIFDVVKPDAMSTGFIMPEIMIRAHDAGFRVKQVEVVYHPRLRGVATSGSWRVVRCSLCDLFRFWWKRARSRKARARLAMAGVGRAGA
jgi:glycosyltransferase involved in cell wall biosynthesis